jgi:TRAP-type uncharacterized transport system fused permease subunit
MKASGFFLIPFAMLGYWLIRGYTPQYAAFWSVVCTLFLALLNENYRPDFSNLFQKYRSAVQQGARQAAMIASICASAQVIISVIAFTGLGVKISSNILAFSQSSLFLALVLTGLTSMILGMEVPTTAAYIVAVVVSGPVLIEFGVQPIAAHLFVFYLAILSAVTPPVCGAIFIAAGMADANWLETAKFGLKLCFAAFLIPFLFVYDPALVLIGSPPYIVLGFGRALIAIMFLSAGFMGYFNGRLTAIRRFAVISAGVLLFVPQLWADLAGLLIGAISWFSVNEKNMRISEKRVQI